MRKCVDCGDRYDPEESFYPDICNECAAIMEGVGSIAELRGDCLPFEPTEEELDEDQLTNAAGRHWA